MTRPVVALLALVVLVLSGCAAVPGTRTASQTDAAPAEAVAGAAPGRVLVMLNETFTPHYRPDAGGGGYGARASGQQARRARALGEAYGFKVVDDWPMPALGVRCFVAEVTAGATASDIVERLAKDPRVESAQTLQSFRVLGAETGVARPVAAPAAGERRRGATGKGVAVAQIDTGVDLRHPALRGQIAESHNFVDGTPFGPEFHGTAVAGIIVARSGSDVGGVAPGASLASLRACWPDPGISGSGVCDTFTLAKALQFVLTRDFQILNLSLGGPRDRLLERLLDKAMERGITIFGAVDPHAQGETFPAYHAGVVAVATEWSSHLPRGTILAPGSGVLTTIPDGRWGLVTGTSFATAHAAGVAALVLECSPRLKAAEVGTMVRASLRSAGSAGGAVAHDVCGVLPHAATGVACTCCCTGADRVADVIRVGPLS